MRKLQTFLAACAASLVLLSAGWGAGRSPIARSTPGETPPGIAAGKKIYWVQTRSNTLQAIASTTPVEVLETRGAWVLVESNGISFGPVWLNFDEVLHYKTEL